MNWKTKERVFAIALWAVLLLMGVASLWNSQTQEREDFGRELCVDAALEDRVPYDCPGDPPRAPESLPAQEP